jgi:carbon storage regulator
MKQLFGRLFPCTHPFVNHCPDSSCGAFGLCVCGQEYRSELAAPKNPPQKTAAVCRISSHEFGEGDSSESGAGMLVLSRKRDESIIIDGNIVITVVDIRGDKVRLGIEAPSTVPVHRKEVFEALQRENVRASAEAADSAPKAGV